MNAMNLFQFFTKALFLPLFLAGSFYLFTAKTSHAEALSQPNILFVLVDDLGWQDLGFMGSDYYLTPNIDALAESGVQFTDAYASSPNCAPTRAALMSGLYAPRTQVYTVNPKDRGASRNRAVLTPNNHSELDSHVVTIAERFKQAGYHTGFFGKWHLGEHEGDTSPLAQGFDVNVGGFHKGHPASYFSPFRNPAMTDGEKGEYLTDRLTSEAIGFIGDAVKQHQPFFAFVSYYAVHTPIQPKPELVDKYNAIPFEQRQGHPGYGAMVETLDNNVGRLIAALNVLKVSDDTLIVFTSDNGGSSKATTIPRLRGAKGMIYEGGVRVPLIVAQPGTIKAGLSSVPVASIDFYPTLLGQARIPSEHIDIDGVDFSPILNDTSDTSLKARPLYWHFPFYLTGASSKKKKNLPFNPQYIATPHGWRAEPASSIRVGDYKLIEWLEDGKLELYDLNADLSESTNLASALPELTQSLKQRLHQWRESTGAHMPIGPNPQFSFHPSMPPSAQQ